MNLKKNSENILKDEEIEKIKQEEFLRDRLRNELSRQDLKTSVSRSEKCLKFLNSAFGIWLAGVLALTVAPNLYQYYGSIIEKQKQEEILKRRNIEEVRMLSTEISYRLSTVLMRLKAVDKRFGDSSSDEAKKSIEMAFYALGKNPDQDYYSLLPQYKNMNGIAIMSEMARLEDDDGRKKVILDSMGKISSLIEVSAAISSDEKSAKEKAAKLLTILDNKMKELFFDFPNLDCRKNISGFPFC